MTPSTRIILESRALMAAKDDASPGEFQTHGPIPWHLVVRSPSIWLLGGAMVTMAGTYEILISWYPMYLEKARGQPGSIGGPHLHGAGGRSRGLLLRRLADRLAGPEDRKQTVGPHGESALGGVLAALGIASSLVTNSTMLASIFIALACLAFSFRFPPGGPATQVSGRHVGDSA